MSPEGPIAKGTLFESGHVVFVATMDASKCYAVVAFGAGITELDVNLLGPPLYTSIAAQDGMTGATAVVGASPKLLCPAVPFPFPYKVDLHARIGGGTVAAQLYAKRK
jgi:hypothetical protein